MDMDEDQDFGRDAVDSKRSAYWNYTQHNTPHWDLLHYLDGRGDTAQSSQASNYGIAPNPGFMMTLRAYFTSNTGR